MSIDADLFQLATYRDIYGRPQRGSSEHRYEQKSEDIREYLQFLGPKRTLLEKVKIAITKEDKGLLRNNDIILYAPKRLIIGPFNYHKKRLVLDLPRFIYECSPDRIETWQNEQKDLKIIKGYWTMKKNIVDIPNNHYPYNRRIDITSIEKQAEYIKKSLDNIRDIEERLKGMHPTLDYPAVDIAEHDRDSYMHTKECAKHDLEKTMKELWDVFTKPDG